eukprot:SAG31_NODE_17627_length_663_cov_2.602837_1_plen_29_part_10
MVDDGAVARAGAALRAPCGGAVIRLALIA